MPKTEYLQGALDLLILKTLALGPNHGWGIQQRIRQVSRETLTVSQGSLYPALHRLEAAGMLASEMTRIREQPQGAGLPATRRPAGAGSRRKRRTGASSRSRSVDCFSRLTKLIEERDVRATRDELCGACSSDRRVAREMDDELRFHLEMEIQSNIARGMAPSGGPASGACAIWAASIRRKRRFATSACTWLESVWQDVRQAARSSAALDRVSARPRPACWPRHRHHHGDVHDRRRADSAAGAVSRRRTSSRSSTWATSMAADQRRAGGPAGLAREPGVRRRRGRGAGHGAHRRRRRASSRAGWRASPRPVRDARRRAANPRPLVRRDRRRPARRSRAALRRRLAQAVQRRSGAGRPADTSTASALTGRRRPARRFPLSRVGHGHLASRSISRRRRRRRASCRWPTCGSPRACPRSDALRLATEPPRGGRARTPDCGRASSRWPGWPRRLRSARRPAARRRRHPRVPRAVRQRQQPAAGAADGAAA